MCSEAILGSFQNGIVFRELSETTGDYEHD